MSSFNLIFSKQGYLSTYVCNLNFQGWFTVCVLFEWFSQSPLWTTTNGLLQWYINLLQIKKTATSWLSLISFKIACGIRRYVCMFLTHPHKWELFACMHMYMCTHMHTVTHTVTHTRTHIHTHAHAHTHTHTHTYTHTHTQKLYLLRTRISWTKCCNRLTDLHKKLHKNKHAYTHNLETSYHEIIGTYIYFIHYDLI